MNSLLFIAGVVICLWIVLPIVAIVRTGRIKHLERRLEGVEAALLRVMREQGVVAPPPAVAQPTVIQAPPPPGPQVEPPAAPLPAEVEPAENLETVIGQKWLGWVAIVLIFGAAAFFLKYAFDNRWIGELGRVTLGMAVGIGFAWGGLERHRKGWRYLSQVLTAGGITILYLSVYGSFKYYHLVDQRAAFLFLVILVAESYLLALVYNARSIAIMALAGGFLVPVLLATGRDQFRFLFAYMATLDLGMLAVIMVRRWRWLGSLAYIGTQVLFWSWYGEHYHPEKRAAVLAFQAGIFLLFVLADLAPHLRREAAGWEEWIRLIVNPFVFYATCYFLLNDDHHEWMATLALVLAVVYAAAARGVLALRPLDRRSLAVIVGTALAFATLAIPVQLEANWITIAWGAEAVALLWAGIATSARPLRLLSAIVMALALARWLFVDTPWGTRAAFTPVLNRYYLGTLALVACLAAAAYLSRRFQTAAFLAAILAVGVLWLGSTVEVYSYFDVRIRGIAAVPNRLESVRQLRWSSQLTVSTLWSLFAGAMTAAGLRLDHRAWRVAGLALFGLTLVKVVALDISQLQQFYRILTLLGLGVVLLLVAWKYQRGLRRGQAR